ncbi:IS66 Orf2 family protein [Magnetococcus marinus MC-1]|uniref:IS66 Orf2 family protein n=1 Tax=Magnetococcus marinus (strain ATCC BAA-1437 / JCM 17883 / MC-1) TaxID=156889 RepID=A0LAY2_MAGMM|nr:IS66 family insertion sequence element accessory protein TnpB [Magnetococcus marinus]ABK45125.1 IS66 Orf2 family protein [Magnetococcus marinus MC-1]ABK45129.1 IS66 Orf2 family protein [Magnetococcus marinus MC-1]ABK45160.1 IS66 Orf2 family protein [Magnetococcus marinus MC-1]
MMRPSPDISVVHLCLEPVDFRKGINGLAALVEAELELNPFDEALFVFRNRSLDKVKILYWEQNGFCLWQKRLEKDRFHWLRQGGTAEIQITGRQLNWLLDGYNLAAMKGHNKLHFSSIV